MAKPSPQSGSSKNKDDDSWGKLATDLLGIQFGGPDDDFDLPDEDAPPAKAIVAASVSEPAKSFEPLSSIADSQAEPDLSFPEGESSEDEVERVSADEPVDPRDEPEKDIWDMLGDWNWDEPVKPAARSHADQPQGRGGQRPGGRGTGGRRPERDSSRERPRDRGEERPPRQPENAAPSVEHPPRDRSPQRDEAPRRPATRDELARTEKRPTQQVEPNEQKSARSIPPRTSIDNTGDGFAAGLDDEPKPRRIMPAPTKTSETVGISAVKKPVPAENDVEDDFASDLFQELSNDTEDDSSATTETGEGENESSENQRHRPRRRRRRGGRGRRTEANEETSNDESNSSSESINTEDPFALAADNESSDGDERDDSIDSPVAGGEEESSEQRRSRRRRRRGRQRPDEQPTEVATTADDERFSDDDQIDESEVGVRVGPVDEEPLAPVNYEGIPTWEEAISYLIRSRGPEPRGRGNGGSRGRGGPPQRR